MEPIPLPARAMPLAKARFFSKYWPTMTILGEYASPVPIPVTGKKAKYNVTITYVRITSALITYY